MPSVTCFQFRFTPSWMMTLLAVVVIAFLTSLGFWQIERSQEKATLIKNENDMANKPAITWQDHELLPLPYQRIKVTGRYLPHVFLLDNQHQQHQFGYDVLSPFLFADGSIALVDRGWIAGDTRQTFPHVHSPDTSINIQGSVYFPSSKQWVLGQVLEKKGATLSILESLDTKIVSQVLQKKAYPFIIRLDKSEEHGFVREWAVVSMPPERHLAYAVQWFAMALVVFIIYVALNLKKNENTNQ